MEGYIVYKVGLIIWLIWALLADTEKIKVKRREMIVLSFLWPVVALTVLYLMMYKIEGECNE